MGEVVSATEAEALQGEEQDAEANEKGLEKLDASLEYQGDMLAPLEYKAVIRAIIEVRHVCCHGFRDWG